MVLLTMVLTKYALIHSFLKSSYLSDFEFSILTLSVLLITAGGYIINDIYDVEADKLNKPNKIFIDKTISKKSAWKSYFLLTFLGLILGVFLSISKLLPFHSLYFFITIIGLYFYSKHLKKQILIGNILVSFFCFLAIYMVYVFDFYVDKETFVENISIETIHNLQFGKTFLKFYFIFSFLTTLIREIIKDIEDVNGDLKLKAKTLPILFGRKRASKVAFFFSCILFLLILIEFQIIQLQSNYYIFLSYVILFLLLPLLYFMYKLWFSKSKKEYSKLSSKMKIIMLFGILSMLLFLI
ncbi:geranylgeranylglycerol-phosphate geranylgeranyltransferase [Polaribacter sp. SA4-12]|uniref:geranylgeranylglycerol-phosphate geranylgeranyltransferase n=1 Tax=Polaribacter sp. SA4-12 TaxID=1312072 RepID=UPI0012FC2BF2|nr:geranylgeranylglycerol-phosphate geranylgeranyltransferase [Polaribacter sp. SA4-12]